MAGPAPLRPADVLAAFQLIGVTSSDLMVEWWDVLSMLDDRVLALCYDDPAKKRRAQDEPARRAPPRR